MRSAHVKRVQPTTKYLTGALAGAAVSLLTLFLPAGASPAQKGARMLERAATLAPGLPTPAPTGSFWHTDRNRILDAHNREVRIAGVNWSGFETHRAVPGGLTVQDYRTILQTIRAQGYNTVRLPLSNEMLESPSVPSEIAFTRNGEPINKDLQGLNSLEILDRIVAAAKSEELKIILDDHRSEAGDSAEPSGLWYTPAYPETAWIKDWVMLTRRFRNDSTVIGFDLRNEPHNAATNGACWDCGGARDWHLAAERAGNAVLHENPKLLIFVEGVDTDAGEGSWWGGNLMGVRRSPVHLAVPNRLVYSAHVYGPTEYKQAWFNPSTSAASLRAIWRRQWAYVSETGLAPVWVGEFGTPNADADIQSAEPGSQGQWFAEFIRYLHENPALGWSYWDLNGEDHYGLLDPQYGPHPVNSLKSSALATIVPTHREATENAAATPVPPAIQGETMQRAPATPAPAAVQPPATDPYAAAAREEVEQMLYAPQSGSEANLIPEPAHQQSVPHHSRATISSTEPQIQNAVAHDVQQAIAAAMQTAPAAGSR